MPRSIAALVVASFALAFADHAVGEPAAASVSWAAWSDDTFSRAAAEDRVVLLEVSASWCHWCHVMERETYADPRVAARIAERFVPIKVDADARPDLAERYAQYHWPATVFLVPERVYAGTFGPPPGHKHGFREILALRGYRGPDDFLAILARVDAAAREGRSLLDEPIAARPVDGGDVVPLADLRRRLYATLSATWDERQGGWGRGQKYPYAPAVHAAFLASRLSGDSTWSQRALRSVGAWEALIDPAWGGMYQYSEGGTWEKPHFEKIMPVQAGAISAYADAFRRTRDPRWRRDAAEVRRFLTGMLRAASGAFATSQDADLRLPDGRVVEGPTYFALDDAARRRLGLPRIDRAVYAQENGWAIRALVELSAATGDEGALAEAEAAARSVLSTHLDPSGAMRHAPADGVLHLGDQAAFGRALVALWSATGDRAYLDRAIALGKVVVERFAAPEWGFLATVGGGTQPFLPFLANAEAARLLLAIGAATDDATLRNIARAAISAVGQSGNPERYGWRCADLLLAVEEATFPWVRATVVGDADDPATRALHAAALALDEPLVIVERVAPGEKTATGTPSPDSPDGPAVFLCGGGRCSSPVRRVEELREAVRAFRRGL